MTAGAPALALAIGVVLGACTTSPAGSAPGSLAAPSPANPSEATTRSITVVRLPLAEPAQREEATIAMAFDPSTAAELAQALPADLDWTATAVLCVYLGSRADGGWGLAIQSATLIDGELRIRARETRPAPGVDRPGPTYPADCATVDRAALPSGPLSVRADDTVTDEFIVSAELEVPVP
jgi:hypothetical protein